MIPAAAILMGVGFLTTMGGLWMPKQLQARVMATGIVVLVAGAVLAVGFGP